MSNPIIKNPLLSPIGMMNRGMRCYFQITLKDMAQDLGLKVTVLSEYETVQGVVPRNLEQRIRRYWQRKLGQ